MNLKYQYQIKQILKYLGILIASLILAIGLLFLLVYFGVFGSLPDKNALASINNEEASQVISSDNIL